MPRLLALMLPFQGRTIFWAPDPGLKPWADLFRPFRPARLADAIILLFITIPIFAADTSASANVSTSATIQFPLKFDDFSAIADSYDEQQDAQTIEDRPAEEIIEVLKVTTDQQLAVSVNEKIGYRDLMVTPEQFRGEVVHFRSVLYQLDGYKTHLAGLSIVWQGQVSDLGGHVVTFISFNQPPETVKKGHGVEFTGVFMKRFAYLNRQAGDKLTWTPLIFVRNIAAIPEEPEERFTLSKTPTSIILFSVIGIGIFIFAYTRSRSKVAKSNYFTRMKKKRENPKGPFQK